MGGNAYPVFDAIRGSGVNGRYTFPDQAVDPYGGQFPRNRWVADHDTTLVAAPVICTRAACTPTSR